MSPNQRLMVAVVLSIIFFSAYTAIFPPEPMALQENNTTKKDLHVTQKQKDGASVEKLAGHDIPASEKIATQDSTILTTLKAKDFILKLDTLGRIASKELLDERFRDSEDLHAQVIPNKGAKPLFIRFADDTLNQVAAKTPYTASIKEATIEDQPVKVTLTQKLPELTVTKELTFYKDGHYDASIKLSKEVRYFVYVGHRPEVSKKLMAAAGVLVYTGDNVAHIIEDGDADARQTFSDVLVASAFDQYTATMFYGLKRDTTVIVDGDSEQNPVLYFDAIGNESFKGYLGPKEYKTLKAIDPVLTNAIEFGWFTFAAKPLFAVLLWLHDHIGNWGWAIIALTALVRLILYPLTYKGMVSMQKMKQIAPKVKELQQKYKGDPQRMNAAVMELYKKHGANPLGGCLPMLLQIPVFFAMYRVFLNAVELQGAPWILWVTDLSRMDPTFILPILMGASMYLQQRMTPTNFTDPMQEKVMKFLPVIFTFFFVTFPSGLVLYWFVNNLFSIMQQYIVNKQFENAEDLKEHIEKKQKKEKK
ncbi:MAG: membrane protein insertase YidC [Epsilonproteobacteria bacterium]|nr:membrane protein insertase YidC [Campylobacterota bacterium]